MSTGSSSNIRARSNIPEMIIHTNAIDTSSDLAFLIGTINSNNVLFRLLLSSQITNFSFSDLYRKSQIVGWKQVLIELRNNLRVDEKSKPKRFVFNRLIDEYSTNAGTFNADMKKLNEDMKKQLSNSITPEQACFGRLQTINDVYEEIERWRQLQCDRRLFYKEYNQRCSFLTLQKCMTEHFINLVQTPYHNVADLEQLFNHCLIIVVQPSGSDCSAVIRYEKIGDAYLAKIKMRIICLLDPNRIGNYLKFLDVGVTLYLKDRLIDPEGDVQSSLPWKTRTIKCDDNEERTFLYVELNENDSIKLTKKNSNGKLLYNTRLCQLAFQMKFKFIGINMETSVQFNSQYFGLCSHAKYSSKYLTKVFLEEVRKNPQADSDTHMNVLEKYIFEFHECISGVYAKSHTRTFIHEELMNVYQKFQNSAASCTGPVMFFSIDIYEAILETFFSQMKFMGNHPFLSMMYFDSLFLGICTDKVDHQLNSNLLKKPQLAIRFALPNEQQKLDNPNIIFAVHNSTLCKSRITHDYLVSDMSTCICAAVQNEGNQIMIYDNYKTSPFSSFKRYYDPDLSRDNLIQMNNETTYFPLNVLLRNTKQNHPVASQPSNGQQNILYTFDLSGQLTSHEDLTADAIAFLQEQLTHWCALRNIHGSITRYSLENVDITDGDLTEFFHEKNAP